MIPAEITLAHIEEELPAAEKWAAEHGWQVAFDADTFDLNCSASHPHAEGLVRLRAGVDQYRALPPSWRFVHPETGEPTPGTTPNRGARAGASSVIYGLGIICAHFSRTAYRQFQADGPHQEWDLAAWQEVKGGVQAHTLAEMIAVIDLHLNWSTGWLG